MFPPPSASRCEKGARCDAAYVFLRNASPALGVAWRNTHRHPRVEKVCLPLIRTDASVYSFSLPTLPADSCRLVFPATLPTVTLCPQQQLAAGAPCTADTSHPVWCILTSRTELLAVSSANKNAARRCVCVCPERAVVGSAYFQASFFQQVYLFVSVCFVPFFCYRGHVTLFSSLGDDDDAEPRREKGGDEGKLCH